MGLIQVYFISSEVPKVFFGFPKSSLGSQRLLWVPKIWRKLHLRKKNEKCVRQMVSKKNKSKIWGYRPHIQGVPWDF